MKLLLGLHFIFLSLCLSPGMAEEGVLDSGEIALKILNGATSLTMYRVGPGISLRSGSIIPDGVTRMAFEGTAYPFNPEKGIDLNKDDLAEFNKLLKVNASGKGVKKFCGFEPGIALVISCKNSNDDIQMGYGMICFKCDEWRFHVNSSDNEKQFDYYNEMDDIQSSLLVLVKKYFPNDDEIQKLK